MAVIMNAKEYYARPGSRLNNRDAQVVGPALERLREDLGRAVDAVDVVQDASEKGSAFRPYIFDLDDTAAAQEYRLELARHLITAVYVREEVAPEQKVERPLFILDSTQKAEAPRLLGGREYRLRPYELTTIVVSDVDKREQALQDAIHYLVGFKKRVAMIRDLAAERYPYLEPAIEALERLEAEAS